MILPWWPRRGWIPAGPAAPGGPASVATGVRRSYMPHRGQNFLTSWNSLGAWRFSGDLSAGNVFRERLLPPPVPLIDCTVPSGGPFVTGVLDGRRIPSFHQNSAKLPSAFVTGGFEALHYSQPNLRP